MKYIVELKQESYFQMEVEAESEASAMGRAIRHARDGERIVKDSEREWGDFEALLATPTENIDPI